MQDISQVYGFRLSPQQAYQWEIQQKYHSYHTQCMVRLSGNINVYKLKQAVQEVILQNSILHTTFRRVPEVDQPLQVITTETGCAWTDLDLRAYTTQEQEQYLQILRSEERQRPFDLVHGPIVRCTLALLDEQVVIWHLCLPTLCADPWTLRNLVQAVSVMYSQLCQGLIITAPEESLRYVDVTEWLHEFLTTKEGQSGQDYWQKQQHEWGKAATGSLLFKPHMSLSGELGRVTVPLDNSVGVALEEFSRRNEVSLRAVLLACWQCVLWRFQREDTQSMGVLFGGRLYEQLSLAFGPYARHLPLSVQITEDQSFYEIVQQIHQSLLQAEKWQYVFAWPQTEKISRPLIGFAFEEQTLSCEARGVTFEIAEYEALQEPFALYLSLARMQARLCATLLYDHACIEPWLANQLAESVGALLQEITVQKDTRTDALIMISERQRRYLLEEINQTADNLPVSVLPIHRIFEQKAQRIPDASAVICGQECLSYAQLNRRANQLARLLVQHGVQPGEPVGLCLRRSAQALVALLAILKAGGAYVPLDGGQPAQRLRAQLHHSQVRFLITQKDLLDKADKDRVQTFCLDQMQQELRQLAEQDLHIECSVEQIAYVIYTSGSTGEPKGVAVRHRNLLHYTQAIQQQLGITEGMQLASVSTLAADLGHTVLFPALLSGSCLHLLPEEWWLDGVVCGNYMQEHNIDILKIVPSHLQALLSSGQGKSLLPHHALVIGGEALHWSLVREIEALGGSCQIYNHYGPTETTVGALLYPLKGRKATQREGIVPLGTPLANTQIYLLDKFGQLVPPGALGEIYIGGAGVAQGYLHQERLTSECFVSHPFHAGDRLYRTADRGRWNSEGCIEFFGRIDEQVKLRGHRIELGEITAALARHPQVREAIVLLREDQPGDKRLVGYVVAREQEEFEEVMLRGYLHEHIPEFMIPATFVQLPALPLTSNGKINRRALPTPNEQTEMRSKAYVAPGTPIEEALLVIWQEILNRKRISINDNFFELGGHSLLAVQLLEKVQKATGLTLSLATLFQAPTIQHMAKHLQSVEQQEQISWSPLVILQALGSKLPFFCIHPAPGDTYCYLKLVRHLGVDQPVYGLQARGLSEGEAEPYTTLESMATCYVDAMLAIQPTGPYQLGGHSFGGTIAFEMARQLQMRGHQVGLLAIMDTSPLDRTSSQQIAELNLSDDELEMLSATDDAHMLVRVGRMLSRFWQRPLTLTYEELANLPTDECFNYVMHKLEQADILSQMAGWATIRGFVRVMQANQICAKTYVPTLYQGKITLFCPEHKVGRHLPTWSKLSTEPVAVHTVPGDHVSMLTEPHVRSLATSLATCL